MDISILFRAAKSRLLGARENYAFRQKNFSDRSAAGSKLAFLGLAPSSLGVPSAGGSQ